MAAAVYAASGYDEGPRKTPMLLECPNCRQSVSFWRAIRTSAWGRFPCKACGSVLGISLPRRMIALIPWCACVFVLLTMARIQDYGWPVMGAALVATFLCVFYPLERVVLVDRRSFCCHRCGYELEGLTKPRCPECGTPFDPAEKERILARLGTPAPIGRGRWAAVLVITLLVAAVIANIVVFQATRVRRGATPVPAPVSPTAGSPGSVAGQ